MRLFTSNKNKTIHNLYLKVEIEKNLGWNDFGPIKNYKKLHSCDQIRENLLTGTQYTIRVVSKLYKKRFMDDRSD